MSLADTASLTALFSDYSAGDIAEDDHFDPLGDVTFGRNKKIKVGIALIGMSNKEYLSRANTSARDKIDKELYSRYFSEELFEYVYIPFDADSSDVFVGPERSCVARNELRRAAGRALEHCDNDAWVSDALEARIRTAFAEEGALHAIEYHFDGKYGQFRANAGKKANGGDARTYMTVYGDTAGADSSIDHIIQYGAVGTAIHERLHIFTLSDGYDEAFWQNGGKQQALAGNNTEFFVDDPEIAGLQPELHRQNRRIRNALEYSMGHYPSMSFCHYTELEVPESVPQSMMDRMRGKEAETRMKKIDIIQICGPNIMKNHSEGPTDTLYNQDLVWPELNPFQNAYLYNYLGHKRKDGQGGNLWQRAQRVFE